MILNDVTLSTIRSGKGECLHICFNKHNLIVDSGPTSSAGEFRKLCESILSTGEFLDALIITHYDDDHIGGILKVGDLGFHDIFFNAFDGAYENENLSAVQNQRLFRMLPSTIVHSAVLSGNVIDIGGAKITVHAPTHVALANAKVQMKEADVSLGAASDWIYTFDELMDRKYPSKDSSASNQASIVFTFEYCQLFLSPWCRVLFRVMVFLKLRYTVPIWP